MDTKFNDFDIKKRFNKLANTQEKKFNIIINYDYDSKDSTYTKFLDLVEDLFDPITRSTYISKKKYTVEGMDGLREKIFKIVNSLLENNNSNFPRGEINIFFIYAQNDELICSKLDLI